MRAIAAIIFFVLTAMIAQQAAAQQPCPALVVDRTGDDVNGDTSSPCALIANPGSDGITLRAALFAANNATGPGLMTITFAPALAGQTISTTGGLGNPYVSRAGIAIIGLVDSNGQPTVTIDASPMGAPGVLMIVNASNFTLASLRFTGFQGSQSGGAAAQGVAIIAGPIFGSPGNQQVSSISIRGSVFANTSNSPMNDGNYLSLGMQTGSNGALLSNVIITGNTFTNFQGNSNGILVGSSGTNNVIQNVVIDGNSFSNIAFPVEFTTVGNAGNQVVHTRVVGNSFVGNIISVGFAAGGSNGQPAAGNLIDDTLVMGNQFLNNRGPDVGLTGGIIFSGENTNVSENTVSNTQIVNNLMAGDYQYGGISVTGGSGGASNNTVQGVTIANNTIVNYSGSNGDGGAINVTDTNDGSPGNIVSGVTVLNTILWNNTPSDFYGLVTPSQVTTSITAQAGFAGVNGTISSNPQFVDPSNNFELQSGSPALHAGTSSGAPAIDIDCQPRGSPPSIGAYEYEGPDICPPSDNIEVSDTHDFNGDGYSDILWRGTGASPTTVAMWLMNAGAIQSSGTVAAVSTSYSIVGQRDFNGDGDADLLWRDTSGNLYMWFMNGATMSSSAAIGNVPNIWTVVGTADMNADGIGDILWQDTSGDLAIWFMSGSTISSSVPLGTIAPSSNWSIVGTTTRGILWQNTSSSPYTYALWQVNGSTVMSSTLGSVPSNWVVQGMGDFNGDGVPDILWRDSTSGTVAIWFLNSSGQVESSGTVGAVSTGTTWAINETGDFDGNGMSDILWVDGTGNVAIWFMNAATIASTASLGNVGTSWQVQVQNAE